MSKPLPYYPMWVFDFDEDKNVLAMNLAEVGLYVLALNESWKRGSIPDDPTVLAGMIRRKPAEVKKAWAAVRRCWISNGMPGELINPRLEKEREISSQRSAAASVSVRRRWEAPYGRISAPSESVSVSGLEAEEPTKTATGARGEFVDFETFLHRWKQHRGFKKPQKHLIERAALGWEKVQIDEDDLVLALDGYLTSDWARKENYPILGFVKDPHSWIVRAAPEVKSLPAPIDLPPPTVEPLAPTQTRLPYWAEIWNQSVPAGAPVKVWRPSNKLALAYNAASQDDTFGNSAGLIYAKCQDLLTHAPEKATFLTFAYTIENWPKILNGECNWVLMENGKKTAKPLHRKTPLEIIQEGRKNVHSRV